MYGCSPGRPLTIFLAGDVMLGRGVDQLLPHPCEPEIFEMYCTSALDYVRLAELKTGPIARPVSWEYVWGDGIDELARRRPDARIVNLETAITRAGSPEPKTINYRMAPEHVEALSAAGIQACVLANNHVMDWGISGLSDTLATLASKGIAAVGAGHDASEAARPIAIEVAGGRHVILVAFGCPTSGIPHGWQATPQRPGMNLLTGSAAHVVASTRAAVAAIRRPGDIAVASVHWGGNWGYEIPARQRELAYSLIDEALIDVVFGHSSHHPKGIELHRGKPILYGCGDLINDYEGISGYEAYRGDLALMYFLRFSRTAGIFESLEMVPFRIRAMRLERAPAMDAAWLFDRLRRECAALGTAIRPGPNGEAHVAVENG